MAAESILVVDDERDIQELIRYNLRKEGFVVHTVGSGEEALTAVADIRPALIVLDVMLPGMNGVQVCRRLKTSENTNHIPVIMLTARTEEEDIVAGLETGADDYVTKPFSPKVLVARVRSLLRRATAPGATDKPTRLEAHGIRMDLSRYEVLVDGVEAHLSATEFAILEFLIKSPGWVFSRQKIIDAIHGSDYPVTERSVDVQILGLRRKLEERGHLIETVRGVGYRFRPLS